MEPKLHKTTLAEFVEATYEGNKSGWKPLGDRVLVLPDQASEISKGGVTLPPEYIGRMNMSAETGVVVAIGDGAFKWNSDKVTPYMGVVPKEGERVYMERYSGQLAHGHDGKIYRLMESACIGGIKENVK